LRMDRSLAPLGFVGFNESEQMVAGDMDLGAVPAMGTTGASWIIRANGSSAARRTIS